MYDHYNLFTKYSTWRADCCEHRRFKAHQKTDVHKEKGGSVKTGQQTIKSISLAHSLEDPQIWTRISVAHYLASHDVAIDQFGDLLDNHLVNMEYLPAQHYRDNKAAWEISVMISQYLRKLLKERLAETPYFGIMIDETTDISTTQQLILYIKYLKKDKKNDTFSVEVEYLDLVSPVTCAAEGITVNSNLERLILDCYSRRAEKV